MENMVTVEQFSFLVKSMKIIYTQPGFIPDEAAYNLWYKLLCDIDYKTLEVSIMHHMNTSKFPPTPADIRERASQIINKELDYTELEAWHLVRKAISNSIYNSEEEYAKLPPVIQKAVGHPANLKEWAMMNSDEVETVQQSLFARNYTAALKRDKEFKQISPKIRQLMTHTTKGLYIPRGNEKQAIEMEQKERISMPEWVTDKLKQMEEVL